MKATLVAGALAALVYGIPAGAQSQPAPQTPPEEGQTQGAGGSGQDTEAPQPRQEGDTRQEPDFGVRDDFGYDQEGVGGAGDNGVDVEPGVPDQEPREEQDVGGAGDAGQVPRDEGVAPIPSQDVGTPPEEEQSLGGAGMQPDEFTEYDVQTVPVMPAPGIVMPGAVAPNLQQAALLRNTGIFGAQVAMAPSQLFEPEALQAQNVTPQPEAEAQAIGGAGPVAPPPRADMRGLTLLIGGGIEGYTGNLAPEVNPGATAGVSATLRPSRVFGLEVAYSGALNEVDKSIVGEVQDGADIVRNGGHAALTLGLTATPLQPYVMGGVGVSFYDIRNGQAEGFQDDTVGTIPVGLGLRTHLGDFTADARLGYNFLFGQQFAPTDSDTAGSYTGTINLGGTF